jgi:hypothetical protein
VSDYQQQPDNTINFFFLLRQPTDHHKSLYITSYFAQEQHKNAGLLGSLIGILPSLDGQSALLGKVSCGKKVVW